MPVIYIYIKSATNLRILIHTTGYRDDDRSHGGGMQHVVQVIPRRVFYRYPVVQRIERLLMDMDPGSRDGVQCNGPRQILSRRGGNRSSRATRWYCTDTGGGSSVPVPIRDSIIAEERNIHRPAGHRGMADLLSNAANGVKQVPKKPTAAGADATGSSAGARAGPSAGSGAGRGNGCGVRS